MSDKKDDNKERDIGKIVSTVLTMGVQVAAGIHADGVLGTRYTIVELIDALKELDQYLLKNPLEKMRHLNNNGYYCEIVPNQPCDLIYNEIMDMLDDLTPVDDLQKLLVQQEAIAPHGYKLGICEPLHLRIVSAIIGKHFKIYFK